MAKNSLLVLWSVVLVVVVVVASISIAGYRHNLPRYSVDDLRDQGSIACQRSMFWSQVDDFENEKKWRGYSDNWDGLADTLYYSQKLDVVPAELNLDFHADCLLEVEQCQLRGENAILILTDGVPSAKK